MANFTNHDHIKGWGADLDPKDRPAYPKERIPARDIGVHWSQPEQQPQTVKVFKSTERPMMTPVFGASVPPKGLSGMMRSVAFKYSENDLRHWFILIAADRVNMVEGLFEDLSRGHVPNVLVEMGIKAELKHNPKGLAKKVAIAGAVAGTAYMLYRWRSAKRQA